MLNGMSKILTGDLLKILCDMGHGDEIIIADANFPADSIATRLIRLPGLDVSTVLEAIKPIFPVDVKYSEKPAAVMDMTDSDKASGMQPPQTWGDFEGILKTEYPELVMGKLERFEFYERAKNAYAVIQTGEERIYGNLLLVKGVVL
ncbi:MAG: hypothetical protein E7407_00680 [Ruminococcaceae bacterium]|nr:hypothetical protein [Oscillospiraceae bacterium]